MEFMHSHYRHYLQHINIAVSKFQCMTWGWRRDSGLLQHKPVVPTYTILTGLYITIVRIKSVTHNTSFYQLIHGYMLQLQLWAIIRPFVNADIGKIVYCIKMEISPFTLKIHYKCIILCVCTVKGEISILMQHIIFPLPAFIKGPMKAPNYNWNIHLWFV
jgi:hypothetical protein